LYLGRGGTCRRLVTEVGRDLGVAVDHHNAATMAPSIAKAPLATAAIRWASTPSSAALRA
jgi:hypothetical protein